MNLTLEQMQDVNRVQVEMLREFVRVCNSLKLKYYLVHGSLLGAVRYQGCFPYDDDIDVAMPRKDYDRFISEGQELLPDRYFIQSNRTQKQYIGAFAKVRNEATTYREEKMQSHNISHGIYIDVFPIDNYPATRFGQLWTNFRWDVYKVRISTNNVYSEKQPLWRKALRALSILIYPSWQRAIDKRAELYAKQKYSGSAILTGGKVKEKGIPADLFGDGIELNFEGMKVNCPSKYREYLTIIYGDYEKHIPTGAYINTDGTVTVSADIVDTKKSYKEYMRK